MRHQVVTILLALFVSVLASANAEGSPEALIERMQNGGLVIYWRHAATDRTQHDRDLSDMSRCEWQRNLSEQGREEARKVGEGLSRHSIPVEQVLTSAFCRNVDSARIAFGEDAYAVRDDLFNVPPVRNRERQEELVRALQRYLNTPPENPAQNVVIVGHNINLQRAARVRIDEGEIAVFEPGDEGPELLGVLTPDDL